MKQFLLLFIITAAAAACDKPAPDKAHAREMFNAGGLRVITSFANRKQETMSVLYGNPAAEKSALSGYQTHYPGEVFRLVTYKQANNKFWYGSYINGAVQRVETIAAVPSAGKADQLTYTLESGRAPADSEGRTVSAAGRIAYILSHGPSVFP